MPDSPLDAPQGPGQLHALRSAMNFIGAFCCYGIILIFNIGLRKYLALTPVLVLIFTLTGMVFCALGLYQFWLSVRKGERGGFLQYLGLLGNIFFVLIFLLVLYASLIQV
jgi:uncharacterized protein involved in cysteine biosynthesis